MAGSHTDHIALARALEAYESAERLTLRFTAVPEFGLDADRRHATLFDLAMKCGFEPSRHGTPTCLEWTRHRLALLEQASSNNWAA